MPTIEQLQDICYHSNFVAQVIARADFLSPISSLVSGLPASIGTSIRERFPIPEPRKAISQKVNLPEGNVSERSEMISLLRFSRFAKRSLMLKSVGWGFGTSIKSS